MSRPAWINVGPVGSVGAATVTASNNTLTVPGHTLINGDIVMVDSLTGGAVGPLISGAVYFVRNVAGDSFQLSGTRGSQIKEFDSDGTAEVFEAVPAYNAQALRLNDAVTLYHGSADRLGARQGVRPGGGPVISVSGTTWTVHDHTGVVYPGITATSGPYRYHQLETSDSLDPADGANDRVDALDLVIEDDDEDASGFRRSRVEYNAGTPGGGDPAPTPNSLRLGTILVPSGGSPSPSVQTLGQFTVASGGILPIRSGQAFPAAGVEEGMYADRDGSLYRYTSGDWVGLASPNEPERVVVDTSGNFIKANYPWATRARVFLKGGGGAGGGADSTSGTQASFGGGGGAGEYVEFMVNLSDLAASQGITIGSAGTGVSGGTGNSGGTTSFAGWTAAGGQGGFNRSAFGPTEFHAARGGSGGSGGVDGGSGTLIMRVRGEPGGPGTGGPQGDFNSVGGNGASGPFGGGGLGSTSTGDAQSGSGFGAGGAGEKNGPDESSKSGANGTAGVAIFDLYA